MLKRILWFFCVTSVRSTLLEKKNSNPSEQSFGSISKCISEICKTSLNFRSTAILVYGDNETVEKQLFFKEIISTLSANTIQHLIIDDLTKIKDIAEPEADWMVVVYLYNCELLTLNFTEMVHNKIKYLIIVPDYFGTDCKEDLLEIGNNVAYNDVTFMFDYKEKEENTEMYTISTFIREVDDTTCKEVVHGFININYCYNGKLEYSKVFPDKNPTDIKNCPLNVGIGPLYPFSMIKDREKLKTFDKLDESQIRGSDLELVKITAKQFNATLNYNYIKKKEENPIGQYNFLTFIMNGSLDICAGGFYRIYGDIVSYSGVYTREAVKWVYTADRKDKSWQNLVNKVNGLYIFMIYYVAYCCIWCLIRKFDKQSTSAVTTLIYAWGALLGAGSLQDAKSLKQKIVNLMYLTMCLHLSAYIGVLLYSFYTISQPPERLETMNDIMESGRPTYLISESKYFVFDEKYMKYANQSRECDTFYDCYEKSLVYKGMTLLLHGIFTNYQAKTAVDDEARMLGTSENVLTVYYEMLIRKNSAYVAKFQDIIKRLFEAGIPEKLYIEAIGLTVVGRAKSASKNIIANSYSCQAGCRISLSQLDGAFYIWFVGCGISFCVFIVECIRKRERRVSLQTHSTIVPRNS